jgi:hypothetical protein
MVALMGFSFASVLFSYFLIMGGTWLTTLIAMRAGLGGGSEVVGYIILAIGGFLGGLIAGRASRGSTIIEPAIGAVLLVLSFVALGALMSENAKVVLVPGTMKALALTALASGAGGVGGAFVAEKLWGQTEAGGGAWVLYIAVAAMGACIVGAIFGGAIGKGSAGATLGIYCITMALMGGAAGASAPRRPLGAAFLGGFLGVTLLAIIGAVVAATMMNKAGTEVGKIPSEVYIVLIVLAVVSGIAALIGAAIGWAAVGKKNA